MSLRPSCGVPEWVARLDLAGPSNDSGGALALFGEGPDLELHRVAPESGSTLLFDGFLYELEGLARELGREGESLSPIDLLATGWEREGAGLLDRLSGSFLLAVCDERERRAIVAHDALGHHPLYYVVDGDRLWFSANVLALARRTGRTSPDRSSLALTLLIQRPGRGRTFFEGVERLEAGRYLDVRGAASGGGMRIESRRYWHPVPPDTEPYLEPLEALEQFESRLEQSVAARLRLDPNGVMLSGGLDSVCIAAVAGGLLGDGESPLTAYSARRHPDDPELYEEKVQEQVAERLGMPHVTSNQQEWIGQRDLISASLDEISRFPAPSYKPWTGDYMAFARFAAAGRPGLFLTGSGGDEWLTVSPTYAADLIRSLSVGTLVRMAKSERSGQARRMSDVLHELLWVYGARALLMVWGTKLVPGLVDREARRRLARRVPDRRFPNPNLVEEVRSILASRRLPRLDPKGRVPRRIYRQDLRAVWEDSYVLFENEVDFHTQRLAGVVYVSPYHDRRLIEFLFRVEPELLFADSRYKGLVRGLAARRLEGLSLERQQKTYSTEARYLVDSLEEHLPRCFESVGCERLADLGLVEPKLVQRDIDRLAGSTYHQRVKLFTVLSAEIWLAANDHRA